MFAYSLTNHNIVVNVLTNGVLETYSAQSSHRNWDKIIEAIKNADESTVIDLISAKPFLSSLNIGDISFSDNEVRFRGHVLYGYDIDRLIEFSSKGIPIEPLARFIALKMENPSSRSVDELYKFVEKYNLTLTPNGTFLAYKGIAQNGYSIMGNTKTIVVQGKTDSGGHIYNGNIGETIEVLRNQVDADFRNGCSYGLHAGSFEYANSWGPRLLVVEIDPKDVVSVPDCCACQKIRVCKYKIVGEMTDKKKIQSSYDDSYVTSPSSEYEGKSDYSGQSSENEKDYDRGFQNGYAQGEEDVWNGDNLENILEELVNNVSDKYIEGYSEGYQKAFEDEHEDTGF